MAFLLITQGSIFAQKNNRDGVSRPGTMITCPLSTVDGDSRIPAPANFLEGLRRGRTEGTAVFEVTYVDFPSQEAKDAFQYVTDIWSTLIVSDQIIRIVVTWANREPGVLASAGAASYQRDFEGAPYMNTWYPIAMANKLAGRDLDTEAADINSTVSSSINWYFGTDGNTPSGQYDFVTVMLHEMGHGFGFIGFHRVEDKIGIASFFPTVYDRFMENAGGEPIVDGPYPSGTKELGTQLTSNNLFFDNVLSRTDIDRAKLYAPSPYSGGSSIYHLDNSTYTSTASALMTPSVGSGISNHNPGPVASRMFADMGWISTAILHSPQADIEDASAGLPIIATIKSDTTLVTDQIKLYYSLDGFQTEETPIDLVATGNSDEFGGAFPSFTNSEKVSYYISVLDGLDRVFKHPFKVSDDAVHVFQTGPDAKSPIIIHEPVKDVSSTASSLEISAVVTDNISLASVIVEFAIDGVEQTPFDLIQQSDTTGTLTHTYLGTMPLANQENIITYRIIATDASSNANQLTHPQTDRHQITVQTIAEVREQYFNDFNDVDNPTDDFFGEFTIAKDANFADGNLNSPHPYKEGEDDDNPYNSIENFTIPIRIKADRDSSLITFREVVLVEIGEPGTKFGDKEFWDYVIVEGSTDNGETWTPFLDGYDSGDKFDWKNAYNRQITNNQSQAVGSTSIYKERVINMQDAFNAGDIVLIRFRLFADAAARGWGWAIDDLSIQFGVKEDNPDPDPDPDPDPEPPVGIDDDTVSKQEIKLFPNPTNGSFQLGIELNSAIKDVKVVITDMVGRKVFQQNYTVSGLHFEQSFDSQNMPKGMYLINVYLDNQKITKKLLIK